MTLEEIQKAHAEWAIRNFPAGSADDCLLGVGEEVGELMHAHLKGKQGIRHKPVAIAAMKKDAVGDIVIYLMDYCRRSGMSFTQCVSDAWDEVSQRDWQADPLNGGDAAE